MGPRKLYLIKQSHVNKKHEPKKENSNNNKTKTNKNPKKTQKAPLTDFTDKTKFLGGKSIDLAEV